MQASPVVKTPAGLDETRPADKLSWARRAAVSALRDPTGNGRSVMVSYSRRLIAICVVTLGLVALAAPAFADDVGQIKVAKGAVHLERAGRRYRPRWAPRSGSPT